MPTLLQMQWLIVGFFVLIHFLLGMKRGTAKSAWFLLAYVVTATLTFVLIAQFTLTWFFTTQDSMVGLIDWANGLSGGFLTDYRDYYADPAVTPVIFMILDLVFKIILYSILFPILRWLLTLILFRPIWKHVFLKRMLEKQNDELLMAHEESGTDKKFKKKKKLKIKPLGRLSGGLIGAVRGLLVAFVFLLPILVFSSFIGKLDPGSIPTLDNSTDMTTLSTGSETASPLDDIDKYLQEIDDMNAGGFAQITNAITINGMSFDRYVFDSMFTPIINDPVIEDAKVNFIQELENVIDVASIVLNNGYLDRDWTDLSTIDDTDIENLQLIIETVGKSELLSYLLSSGLDKAPELIPTLVTEGPLADIDWSSTTLETTLQYLVDTDWHEEFNRISDLVGALNDFMSPAEIIALMDDPSTLASLDTAQITALTDVIRAVGNLHLLAAINIGIEYAITLPEVQANIAWSDDPETYLRDKLAFILGYDDGVDPDDLYNDGPAFFIGEDGQINKIADLIETILTDDSVDLASILNSDGDIQTIMAAQTDTFVTAVFAQLADLELLVNGLPIGVDFALYQVGGDQIADELAGNLATELADIDWGAEIENIGEIYTEVLNLSIETLFAENPDMLLYADSIIGDADNVASLKAIVSGIFANSDLVGSALETVAPFAIDNMIDDEGLKSIVQGIVLDANDDYDFNIGQEINNVITVAEELNKVIKFSDLGAFGESSLDDKLALVSAFGDMTAVDYEAFRTALTSLQLLTKVDETVFGDIVNYLDMLDTLYVPSDMLLSDEIGTIIDFAHDAATYLSTNHTVGVEGGYEDIDLTGFLPTIKNFLTSTDDRSNLMFYNIVNQLQKLADDGSLSEYLTIPESLPLGPDQIENPLWDAEISALIGAVFDIAASVGEVDGITLSASSVQNYTTYAGGLPIKMITQYADVTEATAAFGNLDNSLILRASVANLIDSQGATLSDSLFGYTLATPSHLVDDYGVLDAGVFTNLINGIATLLDDMNSAMDFTTIGELSGQDISVFLQAFNQTDDASIESLMGSSLIRGIISDMLTDPDFQQGLADTINDAQDIFIVDQNLFKVDDALLDTSYSLPDQVLTIEEASSILLMLKALQLNDFNFDTLGVETFTAMLDRNVDEVTGKDDFDRFMSSGYIYSVIDGILQDPAITNFVTDQLGTSLDIDMSTLNLNIPNEMLGQQADADLGNIEQIEVGRLPKAEFRKIFTSISLVELDNVGIETFTSLVSPVNSPDDFTTFIDSDFIYFILAQLIGFDGFSNYIGTQLSSSFGDMTLNVTVPIDAKGTEGIETGRITRTELRNIMISFSLIDIENPGIESLTDLFETHNYQQESPLPEVDTDNDFYQFIESKFIQSMVSQLLLDDFIIETIAGTGTATELFDVTKFEVPAPGLETLSDDTERLTQNEIFYIFNGLKELGATDNFNDIDLGLDTIQSIDDVSLVKSNYLYKILDLTISNQASLEDSIPDDARALSGDYAGMITKDEIHNLFTAINALPEGTNFTELEMSSISRTDILNIINVESVIVNQMISDQVEIAMADVVIIDNSVLPEAYESLIDYPLVDRLKADEMSALVVSMGVLGIDDLSGTGPSFAVDTLGVTELQELHDLGLGEDSVQLEVDGDIYNYKSYVIHFLITDQIEKDMTLNVDISSLPEAYNNTVSPNGLDRMNADEIQALIDAMDELGITFDDGFSINTVTSDDLLKVHYLGLGNDPDVAPSEEFDSYIIHKLITEQIENDPTLNVSLGTVPEAYFENAWSNDWMKPEEVTALIIAMGEDVLDINFMDGFAISQVTSNELMNVHYLGLGTGLVGTYTTDYESYIIHRLISDQIEADTNLDVSELTIPEAYYVDGTLGNTWLKPEEVTALLTAMGPTVLNIDFEDGFAISTVTSDNLMKVHYLGLGDDPALDPEDELESYIIHKLISEQIESDANLNVDISTVPEAYFENYLLNDWIKPEEVTALLTAMGPTVLNIDFEDGFAISTVTSDNLMKVHYLGLGDDPALDPEDELESYIIHKLISEQIEADANLNVSELTVPEAYYVDGTLGNTWLKPDEVTALLIAMGEDVLDINFMDGFAISTVTSENLTKVHYLGLGTGLVGTYTTDYESYIIHKLISDQIEADANLNVSELTVPEAYYVDGTLGNTWLKPDEVTALLTAMGPTVLNINFNAGFSISNINTTILTEVHYLGLGDDPVLDSEDELDSYIIHKLITSQVESALKVKRIAEPGYEDVPSAYMISTYSTNIMVPNEIEALIETMIIMGIGDLSDPNQFSASGLKYQDLQDIHNVGLGDPTHIITDLDSYIINHMISNGVKAAIANLPTVKIYLANGDITGTEIQGVINAIHVFDPTDQLALSSISFGNADLKAGLITDLINLDSFIIDRQVSAGIIGINLDVPEAYETNIAALNYEGVGLDLNIDEMLALDAAMDVLGLTDLNSGFGGANDLSPENLQTLHNIGRGDDLNGIASVYSSYMVHDMISDALDNSLIVGINAYDGDYISVLEIQTFIFDLQTLGVGSVTSFAGNVLGSFDSAKTNIIFDRSIANNTTLIYYMLDETIDSTDLIVDPSRYDITLSDGVSIRSVVTRNVLRNQILLVV